MLPSMAVAALMASLPVTGSGQPSPRSDRPGDVRPELPRFEPPEADRLLPRIDVPRQPSVGALLGGERFHVRGFRIVGNTVVSDRALRELASPYTNRDLSFADLEALRDALTLEYVRAGYVTSGAYIPDQRVEDGIVEIRIQEGVLARVEVETEGHLRDAYVEERVDRANSGPVNLFAIEERLQILQQDPVIRSIDAELSPGERRGEAILRVRATEEEPLRLALSFDNHEPPSVGSAALHGDLSYANATGLADELLLDVTQTRGLQDIGFQWGLPVSSEDTRLDLYARHSRSDVIEEPFDDLDIESRSSTYGVTLTQPVHRTLRNDARLFLAAEWRRSKNFLGGSGFSFAPGPEDGVSKIAVVRLGQTWTHRGPRRVFAARSMFSIGLDVLGATHHRGDEPDGQFLAWLGQAQWAQLMPLPRAGSQVIARLDAQLADSALLGMEQFAMGGYATVRGYRENLLVRDNGLVGSLELRVPVLRRADEMSVLELAPFVDAGRSWNEDRATPHPRTLASVGLGFRLAITRRIQLNAYWGEDLRDVGDPPDWDLQDDGVHAELVFAYP